MNGRKAYSSDLTDAQWKKGRPLIPKTLLGGHPRTVEMREVLNAIFLPADKVVVPGMTCPTTFHLPIRYIPITMPGAWMGRGSASTTPFATRSAGKRVERLSPVPPFWIPNR